MGELIIEFKDSNYVFDLCDQNDIYFLSLVPYFNPDQKIIQQKKYKISHIIALYNFVMEGGELNKLTNPQLEYYKEIDVLWLIENNYINFDYIINLFIFGGSLCKMKSAIIIFKNNKIKSFKYYDLVKEDTYHSDKIFLLTPSSLFTQSVESVNYELDLNLKYDFENCKKYFSNDCFTADLIKKIFTSEDYPEDIEISTVPIIITNTCNKVDQYYMQFENVCIKNVKEVRLDAPVMLYDFLVAIYKVKCSCVKESNNVITTRKMVRSEYFLDLSFH